VFTESESRAIVERIRQHDQSKSTEVMPAPKTIGAHRYYDPEWHASELARVFQHRPLGVCPVAAVPHKGDYFTTELAGVPLLCVNAGVDGMQVFVNRCSHRGAPLARASGTGLSRLVCPFHSWSYELDGSLAHCPRPVGCELGIDVGKHGLGRLPSTIKAGMVWTVLTPHGGAALAAFDGFAPELERLSLDGHRLFHHETREWAFNWKLGVDAALETYHFSSVHTAIARVFLQTMAIFDRTGDNARMIFPRKRILGVQSLEEVVDQVHINYFFFPATFVLKLPDHTILFRYLPLDARTTRLEWFMLIPAGAEPGQEIWRSNADVFSNVALEDALIAESTQRGLSARAPATFTFTNIEPGVAAFHSALEQAIAAQ
jgi:phenylpropionate dioxygenase-like ring-hydroxylating dioxygenase large terminal subunit